MHRILHSLLIAAITLVYVAGPRVAVEIEHSHEEGHAAHHHPHAGFGGGHADHSHHDHSVPSPDDPVDEERGSGSHTHVVSLGLDVPCTASQFPQIQTVFRTCLGSSQPERHPCPDGPVFSLIKPPQLA